jgi:DNA polymerase III gamma/tau subunit
LTWPQSLTEKYQPKIIDDFVGLAGPKRLFNKLLKEPHPVAILLVGPPGTGKTSMTMAFAEQLPGTLHNLGGIGAMKCHIQSLDRLSDRLVYYPYKGKFHIVMINEADNMTIQSEIQLLSSLDGSSALRPKFGGGWERGVPNPVIWIFSCNGRGDDGTEPHGFEPRFLSRCLVVHCRKPESAEIHTYVKKIWTLEGGDPAANLKPLADSCDGVRDALTLLEVALLTGELPKRPKAVVKARASMIQINPVNPESDGVSPAQ